VKKSSRGREVYAGAVAGLVGLYLLGFGLIWLDEVVINTHYFQRLPEDVQGVIFYAYVPLLAFLDAVGIIDVVR
jgi:hypothetical protein